MNKDLKGIILFAGLFLFICWLLLFLSISIEILQHTPICNPDFYTCGVLGVIMILTTKPIQVIGLIWMSLFGILKTKNPFIKKIFNTWTTPAIILIGCFLLDTCLCFLPFFSNSKEEYNRYVSLSGNFFVIFIFSIGYQFIKLIKEKIHQLRR